MTNVGTGGAVNANANSSSVIIGLSGSGNLYAATAIVASTSITFSATYTV
jgi:hypothetical protein